MPLSGYGLRSVAGAVAGGRADRRHAGGDDDAPDAALGGRLDRDPRARPRSPATPGAAGREATIPAVWNRVSTPSRARRIERRSRMSASTTSTSRPGQRLHPAPVADGHPHLVAAGGQAGRDVRAEEAGRAGDADPHPSAPARIAALMSISLAAGRPGHRYFSSWRRFLIDAGRYHRTLSGNRG